MKKISRLFLALFCVILTAAILTGCDGDKSQQQNGGKTDGTKSATETKKPIAEITTKIYFADENGDTIHAVPVKVKKETALQDCVEMLVAGPEKAGTKSADGKKLINVFPPNVKLKSVTVKNNIAQVDFTQELTQRFPGGSTGELLLVSSLANTLTEFAEVKKIQILVEGKTIETISGHLDLSEPVGRFK